MISRAPMSRDPGGLTAEIRQYGSTGTQTRCIRGSIDPGERFLLMFSPQEAWAQTSGVLAVCPVHPIRTACARTALLSPPS
jgi:hypothetical protein